MKTIRVVMADDHPVMQNGIRELLKPQTDIQLVGTAGTGAEALRLVHELKPDVLLLDIEFPDMFGVEVARQMIQEESPVKIIILSAHAETFYVRTMMEMGVAGYLVKEEVPMFIVNAIRGVSRGEKGWVSRKVTAALSGIMRGEEPEAIHFSPREMEVLRLVTKGKTNQQIAALLGVSEKTVEKYVYEVYAKIGVSSRTAAAVYAVREGLVSSTTE